MKNSLVIFLFSALFITACQNAPRPAKSAVKLTLRFEVDSAGNVVDELAKQQLKSLVDSVHKNASKIILVGYSEETGNKEKNKAIAFDMVNAAKNFMLAQGPERIYYSVGIDARGYQNPVNAANPSDLQNRRLEVEYLVR